MTLLERPRGKPRYVIEVADLVATVATCEHCGGPRWVLIPTIPDGMQGDAHREVPSYEKLGGYTKYIRPWANHAPCSACAQLAAIARLNPGPQGRAVESPADAFVAELRAAQAPAPPSAPSWSPPPDARFDVGTVYISQSAGCALETCYGRNLLSQGIDRASVASVGRGYAPRLLEPFVRGDCGLIGNIADGDARLGMERGPLASLLDRNAAAVASGAGSVIGTFKVTRVEPRRLFSVTIPETTFSGMLGVWTEVGIPRTLVFDVERDGVEVP